ncbi:hypothetical protein SAMN05421854_10435 [Amycolatopsis rubida]|uniref:Uncharacterized protein n=1 Tax=Amycolatopsis rubida TaxID=112413 RepID=A0A1I5MG03_9PSEU|nr:hypothetical protein SAMN05421854_10435 [Amycolatopsis rubida]
MSTRYIPDPVQVPSVVPVLGHRCTRKHRTAVSWARCAFPGSRPIQGRTGRLLVVHPCRLLSCVVVDSEAEAEKVLNWDCCGSCYRDTHVLYAVTRKPLPDKLIPGPEELPPIDPNTESL